MGNFGFNYCMSEASGSFIYRQDGFGEPQWWRYLAPLLKRLAEIPLCRYGKLVPGASRVFALMDDLVLWVRRCSGCLRRAIALVMSSQGRVERRERESVASWVGRRGSFAVAEAVHRVSEGQTLFWSNKGWRSIVPPWWLKVCLSILRAAKGNLYVN
jgi:hypothetical protein